MTIILGWRRGGIFLFAFPVVFFFALLWQIRYHGSGPWPGHGDYKDVSAFVDTEDDPDFIWRKIPPHYAAGPLLPLPTDRPLQLRPIQARFPREEPKSRKIRLDRQATVKEVFNRCWTSYKKYAWTKDELSPVSGSSANTLGGWGATLIDSLDTLWIMGMRDEFKVAVDAAVNVSFETTVLQETNVFETNIRYLGGYLAAYDLSGDSRLLRKAKEVGDMLYVAFDTPNRLPITHWNPHEAADGVKRVAQDNVLVAEMGSFSMEFTRLSLLTGDPKWFDAAQRIANIFEAQQESTQLPGMWPIVVNAKDGFFNQHNVFTLGAMADSLYEYLPKTYALTGGLLPAYGSMYEKAMTTAIKHNLFRPMVLDEKDMLMSGSVNVHSEGNQSFIDLDPDNQHLACFAGGMFGIGSKLFNLPDHLDVAQKLVDGCIWSYQAMPLGIMPESFHMLPCPTKKSCPWSDESWKQEIIRRSEKGGNEDEADTIILEERLPKGFTKIGDRRYILRPEAIESIFVLYRITGREDLLEAAWEMFEAIEEHTRTYLANAALSDVTVTKSMPPKTDSMESFWMGETLKYFYLIFSEPSLISLDEYVFNTEAHPLRRLVP